MPRYRIQQYELHTQEFDVEAQSEAKAVLKLYQGAATPVDGGLELIEVCDDYGLSVDEHPELAAKLAALGVRVGSAVIPSIHSIEQVE